MFFSPIAIVIANTIKYYTFKMKSFQLQLGVFRNGGSNMGKIYNNMLELVGNTPLVELRAFAGAHRAKGRVIAKLEKANPAGSVKDRAALNIIHSAEEVGVLKPGGMIIEATSGNTGVGLAAVSAVLGYRAVIVMPDSMSIERRALIAAYGAEVILTPGNEGMKGAIQKAEELHRGNEGSIIAGQFVNMANPDAHYRTTGPEIWQDTDGRIDAFVSGVGTGGTITGVGRYLKEQKSTVKIFAVEPDDSAVLSGGSAGAHKIQGIGAGFIPDVLDTDIYDEVVKIGSEEAKAATHELARTEGLLVGISSGAAALAAARIAARPAFEGKTVVVLLPDTGERYLSVL
jgi:cysteine synthase A